MKLVVVNHPFRYETEKLSGEFFPESSIEVVEEKGDEPQIITEIIGEDISVSFDGCEKRKSIKGLTEKNEIEKEMAKTLYEVLSEKTGYSPEWGILTGIRPTKVMRNLVSSLGEEKANAYFRNELFVSEGKTALAGQIVRRQKSIIDLSENNSFSLYISIPFCPTRCSYCSFISHSLVSAKKLIPEYTEKLVSEIGTTGLIARSLGLKLETVYFGGGTPTSLDEKSIRLITEAIERSFDLSTVREYTVEAGRPDTITKEKLVALRDAGVTRISINPQTFNDNVLKAIGRLHSSGQTEQSFILARELGFDNINMDLIAGLPGDSFDSFAQTLDKALSMEPENITVHTLAIKRSSFMGNEKPDYLKASLVRRELETVGERFKESYFPYYMYRQSKSVGNYENVGWCKTGKECLYNIFMMEETHTVLACGAGAVTKLREPGGEEIERIFNFKYPYEYINNYGELISRKDRINQFYKTYNY